MKYSPYSFSKLSTHKQCNRKFYYSYIEKAPKSKTDMTALLKGGAVHSILERFPEETNHKLAPKYQYIVDKFTKTKTAKKYLFRESMREFDFGLTYDLKPTKYSDKSALFRGSIDYICTIDDVLYLCDYKTGKYKEEKWQSYDQLMFYAIYFFQRYETINQIRISYIYVEHEDHENDLLLNRKYLDNYVNQLMELINDAESDENFEKNPSGLCEYCDYKEYCQKDKRKIPVINIYK